MRTLAVVAVLLAMVGCSGDSDEESRPDPLGVRAGIAEAEGSAGCIGICRSVGGGQLVNFTTGEMYGEEVVDRCPGKIRPCPAAQH
jgi:hypothetical protein